MQRALKRERENADKGPSHLPYLHNTSDVLIPCSRRLCTYKFAAAAAAARLHTYSQSVLSRSLCGSLAARECIEISLCITFTTLFTFD